MRLDVATEQSTNPNGNGRSHSPKPGGLTVPRVFSREGIDPFEEIAWETRTAEIKGADGSVVYRQEGVQVPAFWSQRATDIVASKYFYGDADGDGDPSQGGREQSVHQLVRRVCHVIALWGLTDGYFASWQDAEQYRDDLAWLCLNQYGAFNSPVWFNLGLSEVYGLQGSSSGYRWVSPAPEDSRLPDGLRVGPAGHVAACKDSLKHPQISACFIQSVTDDMAGIMALATSEAMLFKFGSGTGTDLTPLRSTREKLSGGGKPSGPVSFLRVYDTIAGQIKSGGRSRRSAKMNTLRCHHPDILEFIRCKAKEDVKARALIATGYSARMTGSPDEAYSSVAFQNVNLSVGCTEEFLRAAGSEDYVPFATYAVTTGDVVEYLDARRVLDAMAEGAWACGDPGVHYVDAMNRWHTCPNSGPINTSNPCLRRGSRLLTDNGWVKVEELADAANEVRVFDGFGFVPGDFWWTGRKSLVRLHTNSGETLDLTPDHRIYTERGWLEARECEGAIVPRVIPNLPSTGQCELPRAISGASGRFYNHAAIDLMESLGFLQGDGGLRDEFITVYYTPEKDGEFVEESVLPVLQDIAADKGEIDYTASPMKDRSAYVLSRRKLVDWLRSLGFAFCPLPDRQLPSFLWSTRRNSQAAFLRGLFGANGNVLKDSRTVVNLVSTCRRMLQDVQLLLRTMGISSAVRVHNKSQPIDWENGTYVSREAYRLEITHQQDIAQFARVIGFPQQVQQERLEAIVKDSRSDKRDGGFAKRSYMTIVRVEELPEEDDVYDFRAPTTSMGLCEGLIVHNCSEFIYLDDTACNLASLNLLQFRQPDGTFDVDRFRAAVRVFLIAQEILVDRASYPTAKITENSHRFRPLGLGYANLGAYLMASGLAYDSEEGRSFAGAVTAVMTAEAYQVSSEMAQVKGPFEGFPENRAPMLRVMEMHRNAAADAAFDDHGAFRSDLWRDALALWTGCVNAGWEYGYRNAQTTLLAPTGTIAFLMDCDTTGIEPALGLVTYKSLAGGGMLRMANGQVPAALTALGYAPDAAQNILQRIESTGSVEGSPIRSRDLPVFDCAFPARPGGRSISWTGHVKMMAAVQPFLSGSISKTCNLPASATIEDIRAVYLEGWRLGLKALAVYRDGSKGQQPVTTQASPSEAVSTGMPPPSSPVEVSALRRERLPDTRKSITHKLSVGGHEAYVTAGLFPDGRPGEIFVTMAKEGSTVGSLMDQWATAVSIGLQYGVPLSVFCSKFAHTRYEPSGVTGNPSIRIASSLTDYIARWLEGTFPGGRSVRDGSPAVLAFIPPISGGAPVLDPAPICLTGPPCLTCGAITVPSGRCYVCATCGLTSGCS